MSPDTGLNLVLNQHSLFSLYFMYSGGVHQLGLKLMKSMNYRNSSCCISLFCSSVIFTPSVLANTLSPSLSNAELETITVVSSKIPLSMRELATSVSVIEKEDIEARGNISLADVMRHEVGVGVSNSGGIGKNTTLRVRGEDGFRTKVYIDGVELSDPTAPQVTPIFDDMLTTFIDRVEILRGPQGLMYGADAGGVVSITTKQSEMGLTGSVNTQIGSYSSSLLSADIGYANKTGHIYVAAAQFETDGFNAQTADETGDKDGYQNTSLHLNTGLQINESLLLNVVLRNVDAENEYDGCFDNTTFAPVNACRTESENQTARLSLQYEHKNMHHQLGYAKTDVERQYFSQDQFSFASEGEINKVEYRGYINLAEQKIIWGADNESQKLVSSGEQREQTGLFAEYQASWHDQFFMTAGVRHDDNETFGSHHSYRLSAAYLLPLNAQELIKLKSSYGTGFRAPSLYEQAYNDGDYAYGDAAGLQLKEETSKGFDIGIDYNNHSQKMSLVYFNQSIANEIYFDSLAYTGYLQNSLSSNSKGIEFELSQTLFRDITLWSNYTYNHTQTNADEERIRRPKHQANAGVQTALLDDMLTLNVTLKVVRDLVDIGGVRLDDYHLVNFTSRYKFNELIQFTLRAENLFDRHYQDVVGFNTAGRTFYVGAAITL